MGDCYKYKHFWPKSTSCCEPLLRILSIFDIEVSIFDIEHLLQCHYGRSETFLVIWTL